MSLDRLLQLTRYAELTQQMTGHSLEQILWMARPTCRRCGRQVQQVNSSFDPDAGVMRVWFSCHEAHMLLPIAQGGMGHLIEIWPTHVFDYEAEAENFGSWDANGAPVEGADELRRTLSFPVVGDSD